MIKIMKKSDFKNKIILGPMAGVTDLPFRLLCKKMGCDIMITEMISAKGLMYNNHKTEVLLLSDESEHPVGVQLFGSDPDIMAGQAEKLSKETAFDFIDINMGCPVPKIVGNHEGSALMKNPGLAADIVKAMVKASDIPVTVKIRAGFSSDDINAPEVAAAVAEAGASAVAVHARTREQFYSGNADWSIIKRVRDAVKIPLIGNGDICTAEDVIRMKEETGCDSVMIARAAKGNPWVFREIKAGIEGREIPPRPTVPEIADMMAEHVKLMVKLKGEYIGVREMRKHVAWYTEGIRNSARLRRRVSEITTTEGLLDLIRELKENS